MYVPVAVPAACAQESAKEEENFFMAQKAFDDGFYDVSLGLLERFVKNYPTSVRMPEVNLLVGQCYFHQNKFLDALKTFELLINQPRAKHIQDACVYWVAEVHFRGNNFTKAAEYYKKIIDNYPTSSYLAAAHYSLGWCLFQERDYAGAMSYFKIVTERFGKESFAQDAAFKILECFYNMKDYQKLKISAESSLAGAARNPANSAYLSFYIAEAEYYLGNYESAIDAYAKVVTSGKDAKMVALSRLGTAWCYLKLKQYAQAQDILNLIPQENLEKTSREVLLLGKAVFAAETKQFNQAQQLYDELLATTDDPLTLVQAYMGKAEVHYNADEFKQAIAMYQEALTKLPPGLPQEVLDKLHYGLAWAHLKEGEFKPAIDEFQKIAKNSEDRIIKVAALCQIGDAYQDSGDYTRAMETYDTILKDYPDSLYGDYVQYQLGLVLLKSSNYEGAIMALQNLKRNFPESKLLDDATYALGLSYFQREDYSTSAQILRQFQQDYRDSNLKSQAVYLLGTSLFNLASYAEAIEVFRDIVKNYSQDIELVQKSEYEIADCYYQMGNEKEAMERFTNLRSKYPDSTLTPEVMWWLGEYYYRHNDLSLARRYFSSLIQDYAKSNLVVDAYYALGSISEQEAKYDEAESNFQKVIDIGHADLSGTAAIAIADLYVKKGQAERALEKYKAVAQSQSNLSHLIYPKIADLYRSLSKYDEALDFYAKSLQAVPLRQMGSIQFKIAETKEAQGKKDQAIEDYLKVTYLYPENNELAVKSLLRIAAMYEEGDNSKAATAVYTRLAGMNVEESKYAQERLDWIKEHVQ
jgi:TolA-binding protein